MNNTILDKIKSKILSLDDAIHMCRKWKKDNKKVVFTNGVFDILHAGHVQSLAHARAEGDCLIVGLNTDASVRRLKGNTRPIISESDRALLLASLLCVDAVILFEEDTPLSLIRSLLPDVLVKSADYTIDKIVGAEDVMANGGEVKIMPFIQGLSTTKIIEKIKND